MDHAVYDFKQYITANNKKASAIKKLFVKFQSFLIGNLTGNSMELVLGNKNESYLIQEKKRSANE